MTKTQEELKVIGSNGTDFFKIPLKNKAFSIISNNCWGGCVYDRFHLPYLSPTIGGYFYADDFIAFVSDLKNNLIAPIRMITAEESKYREELMRKGETGVPIGLINGSIEYVFLHYRSSEDAKLKWEKRCKRVHFDNLIIKMNDQNLFGDIHYAAFKQLQFKNKLLLTGNTKYMADDFSIFMNEYSEYGFVLDDTTEGHLGVEPTQYLNSILN